MTPRPIARKIEALPPHGASVGTIAANFPFVDTTQKRVCLEHDTRPAQGVFFWPGNSGPCIFMMHFRLIEDLFLRCVFRSGNSLARCGGGGARSDPAERHHLFLFMRSSWPLGARRWCVTRSRCQNCGACLLLWARSSLCGGLRYIGGGCSLVYGLQGRERCVSHLFHRRIYLLIDFINQAFADVRDEFMR